MKYLYYTLAIIILSLFSKPAFTQTGIDKPVYRIDTYRDTTFLGSFHIELFPLIAPLHVANFDSLAGVNFFDSTAFHRVVPGFVIQGGDPNSISGPISTWGQGQPWQPTVPAEFNAVRHLRGILGAARDTDPNSATSQFYICVASSTFLDGNYTVYGKVTNGMSVVDTIVLSPKDVNDVPLQKISMFITSTGVNDTIPDPVNLTAPADNSVNISNTQSFSWTTVADAVLYTAEFATDSLFTNIVLSRTSGTNSSTASALPGSSTYYWRVKSNNGGHESVYSPYWKFTTVAGAATLTSPPDSSVNVFINPVFEWQAVPGADNYQLQVATASTFILPSLVYNQSGLTNTSQQIPALNANTRYYWRVRSYTGSIAGYYSTKFTFLTGASTGIQHFELSDMITAIYPNPATDFVYADVKPSVREDFQIAIRDINGKVVYTENKSWSAVIRIAIDVSDFQKGFYVLELKNGNKISAAKFVVE